MSHGKLRHDNNCLNCNAIVQGRFCGICGQENLETKESLGQIIRHFFEDITHFDGKFFSSLKLLLFKPGLLSRQYRIGKRAQYLNPVRMYIFTSFVFFLILFTFKSPEKNFDNISEDSSIVKIDFKDKKDSSNSIQNKADNLGIDSINSAGKLNSDTEKTPEPVLKETLAEYKKHQDTAQIKDNFIFKYFKLRGLKIEEKYRNNKKQMWEDGLSHFLHSLPQFLFVSLPLIAFLLLILYSRRKEYNYVNHSIFVIHYYIFLFIIILFAIGSTELYKLSNWSIFIGIKRILLIYGVYYLYRAMRNYYQQGRGKTFLKFFFLLIGIFFVMSFLFLLFTVLAMLNL